MFGVEAELPEYFVSTHKVGAATSISRIQAASQRYVDCLHLEDGQLPGRDRLRGFQGHVSHGISRRDSKGDTTYRPSSVTGAFSPDARRKSAWSTDLPEQGGCSIGRFPTAGRPARPMSVCIWQSHLNAIGISSGAHLQGAMAEI